MKKEKEILNNGARKPLNLWTGPSALFRALSIWPEFEIVMIGGGGGVAEAHASL